MSPWFDEKKVHRSQCAIEKVAGLGVGTEAGPEPAQEEEMGLRLGLGLGQRLRLALRQGQGWGFIAMQAMEIVSETKAEEQ